MSVQLVNVTPNAEHAILYIARVSSKDQNSKNVGLIDFLIRNGHWSPFEHASMTLEIVTSRAISQQITRHRSFTFQEFSQRYSEVTEWVSYEARAKGDTNRQGSVDTLDEETKEWWRQAQKDVADFVFAKYSTALAKRIAPECARFVLPISTQTKLYMTGTLRSWIHYLGSGPGGRTNPHTQKEHRDLALAGQNIFCGEFPIISQALGWRDAD